MDKLSPPVPEEQIFTPFTLMNPNLYYNSFINPNLLLTEQSPNYSNNNSNSKISNKPQISKNKTKKNTSVEISLISLLNAISDVNSQKINTKKQTPQKENSNKNESFSSESEKQGDSYTMMELLTQKTINHETNNQSHCEHCAVCRSGNGTGISAACVGAGRHYTRRPEEQELLLYQMV